jgi:hypothetical protein
MSEALSLSERIAARLERLAEMDLAAAEHVHAQLLATTEAKETAELARAYQRASRTLRQTLMLQMKHVRDQADAQARAKILGRRDEIIREERIEQRTLALQDAVCRVAGAAIADFDAREERLDRLDVELDDWLDAPDYLTADLDAQVLRACRLLDLPEDLAAAWRTLPPPVLFEDTLMDLAPDPAAPPPVPSLDTG